MNDTYIFGFVLSSSLLFISFLLFHVSLFRSLSLTAGDPTICEDIFSIISSAFRVPRVVEGWVELESLRPDFDAQKFIELIVDSPSVLLCFELIKVRCPRDVLSPILIDRISSQKQKEYAESNGKRNVTVTQRIQFEVEVRAAFQILKENLSQSDKSCDWTEAVIKASSVVTTYSGFLAGISVESILEQIIGHSKFKDKAKKLPLYSPLLRIELPMKTLLMQYLQPSKDLLTVFAWTPNEAVEKYTALLDKFLTDVKSEVEEEDLKSSISVFEKNLDTSPFLQSPTAHLLGLGCLVYEVEHFQHASSGNSYIEYLNTLVEVDSVAMIPVDDQFAEFPVSSPLSIPSIPASPGAMPSPEASPAPSYLEIDKVSRGRANS